MVLHLDAHFDKKNIDQCKSTTTIMNKMCEEMLYIDPSDFILSLSRVGFVKAKLKLLIAELNISIFEKGRNMYGFKTTIGPIITFSTSIGMYALIRNKRKNSWF